MRIILSKSTLEAVDVVTSIILDKITSHPTSVVGLATGRTMEPVYAEWVERAKRDSIKMDKAFFFLLDEYVGIDSNHPSSFKSYIKQRLILPLNLHESQFAFPPVHLDGEHYESLIKEAGGIDLQLLGLGINGHIGFNEPGSTLNSRTRIVELTTETKESNKSYFGAGEMPDKALSMGIGSIMDGKELLLLATGKSKADAIKYLLNHHDDESCPVTFLKSHPHFTLVLDPEAASKISLKI
ncbi:MAG: glucosamine-6-phosphate deaminase [Bdellovibrionales bacterium]|nr:glucosamine-6-phosphate deaminase [Bdellovibrionales bacterium]